MENRTKLIRFGTGEFTDSLLFEKDYPIYSELVPFFSRSSNAILEIKTKTTNIECLSGIQDHDNTIVSWSMNSDIIARKEESNTPGIEERIRAAQRVQKEGYKLGFHFDML